jgi:hypothetical protein
LIIFLQSKWNPKSQNSEADPEKLTQIKIQNSNLHSKLWIFLRLDKHVDDWIEKRLIFWTEKREQKGETMMGHDENQLP